jgi:Domain of unknown function (DUF4333)
MSIRGAGLVASGCACVLLTSACHASIGKKEVPQHTVETQVAKELAAQVNQPTPTVHCPGDLTAKVGSSIRCTLIPKGTSTTFAVVVTVNSVTNGVAHFSAQVAKEPLSSPSSG